MAQWRRKVVEPEMGLWTLRELAAYLAYTESTVARMVSHQPDRLPPRVKGLGKPRWHPDVVKQWALDRSTSEVNARVGRKREII